MFVQVSARTGQGIDELLEAILLQSEVLELTAPRDGLASGIVVESSIEKGRGAVATVLVKRGTLRLGDPILAGQQYGRVRAMFDEHGKAVTEALPSMPVVVLGLTAAPNAGDELLVVESDRKAREVAMHRLGRQRDSRVARPSATAEDVFSQMEDAKAGVIALLVKTDVQGSAEALRDALTKLSTDEVSVKVLGANVGGITASDVALAVASRARIIGFNVRADSGAREAIKDTGAEVRYYSIIYEAIDDVKQMMRSARPSSAWHRCATCSAPASSASWRDALSPRVRSSATTPSACCATAWSSSRGRWSRCAASRMTSARCVRERSAASA
jgi:translation initiation factor IF-2